MQEGRQKVPDEQGGPFSWERAGDRLGRISLMGRALSRIGQGRAVGTRTEGEVRFCTGPRLAWRGVVSWGGEALLVMPVMQWT